MKEDEQNGYSRSISTIRDALRSYGAFSQKFHQITQELAFENLNVKHREDRGMGFVSVSANDTWGRGPGA